MDIANTLSLASGGADTTSAAAADKASLAGEFDNFLTLLTTQLQHQDPLEPMDSNEFVNQLVSFTQVEQAIKSNKQLESLLAMQTTGQAMGALNYIGQTVEAQTDIGPLAGGKAEFSYALSQNADEINLGVFDSAGNLVFATEGEPAAGQHGFVWDGKDANGNQFPDGLYRLTVGARDADGNTIATAVGVTGRVTGVRTTDDGVELSLGGAPVTVDKVRAVRETAPAGSGA